MRTLSAAELLDIWEWAGPRAPLRGSLQLVRTVHPELSDEQFAGLSLGQLDRRLLALRERLFGPAMAVLADCGGCGQRIEVSFAVDDIRADPGTRPSGPMAIEVGTCRVRFRSPTPHDVLVSLGRHSDVDDRTALLERCVISAVDNGCPLRVDELSGDVIAAIGAEMAAADPQADLRLPIGCPQCEREWQSPFDIVSFFWAEIGAWAHRVLLEVQALAAKFHWSERDILAMSPRRRWFYLSAVNA